MVLSLFTTLLSIAAQLLSISSEAGPDEMKTISVIIKTAPSNRKSTSCGKLKYIAQESTGWNKKDLL